MKLIFAIVSNDDAINVQNGLTSAGYSVTRLSTVGGFLKVGNTTFLCGTEDDRVDKAIEVIKENSRSRTQKIPTDVSYGVGMYAGFPIEVSVGGATIFVTNVDRFEKV